MAKRPKESLQDLIGLRFGRRGRRPRASTWNKPAPSPIWRPGAATGSIGSGPWIRP